MCLLLLSIVFFFFFKQKTAYEMRISDWSSDVCSSDLYLPSRAGERQITELVEHDQVEPRQLRRQGPAFADPGLLFEACHQIGRSDDAFKAKRPWRRLDLSAPAIAPRWHREGRRRAQPSQCKADWSRYLISRRRAFDRSARPASRDYPAPLWRMETGGADRDAKC